jgi:hypothetical protein
MKIMVGRILQHRDGSTRRDQYLWRQWVGHRATVSDSRRIQPVTQEVSEPARCNADGYEFRQLGSRKSSNNLLQRTTSRRLRWTGELIETISACYECGLALPSIQVTIASANLTGKDPSQSQHCE